VAATVKNLWSRLHHFYTVAECDKQTDSQTYTQTHASTIAKMRLSLCAVVRKKAVTVWQINSARCFYRPPCTYIVLACCSIVAVRWALSQCCVNWRVHGWKPISVPPPGGSEEQMNEAQISLRRLCNEARDNFWLRLLPSIFVQSAHRTAITCLFDMYATF